MGGHPCAQTPEQTDRADVSASKRYRLFPSGPTKNVPRLALAAPMLTPWAPAGLLDVVVLDDGRGVELLEQAAASRPIVTTTTVALWKFERTVFLHPCSALLGDLDSEPVLRPWVSERLPERPPFSTSGREPHPSSLFRPNPAQR